MKPDDLFNPEALPDDLKWITAHHRLHPTDPVYLLLAWHWRRITETEDTLRSLTMELRGILDNKVDLLSETAESVTAVSDALDGVQDALREKPAEFGEQIRVALSEPVAAAVTKLEGLEKSLTPLAQAFGTSQRRQFLAVFLIGVTLGILSSVIALLA